MSLPAALLGLVLGLQGPGQPPSNGTGSFARTTDDPAMVRAVRERVRAHSQARLACKPDEASLRQRILGGDFDAAQEASRATARGCFALFVTYSGIPEGVLYAPEVECRPNGALFGARGMALLNVFNGTDVLPQSTAVQERRRDWAIRVGPIVKAYNSAVLAHPAFPYRDLCRSARGFYLPGTEESPLPDWWGFRDLAETDHPADIHEAARRGTLASLRSFIEADPVETHVPDALGVTPLAWAVIYNRPAHARLLLEAGAHPLGWPHTLKLTSPILIARLERNSAMTGLMRAALASRGLEVPEIGPQLD